MAEIFTPLPTTNLTNQTSITANIDANFSEVASLLNDVVSRKGTSPNTMSSQLDMNSNQILNLPSPSTALSPVRLQDINSTIAPTPAILSGNNVYTGNNSFTGTTTLGTTTLGTTTLGNTTFTGTVTQAATTSGNTSFTGTNTFNKVIIDGTTLGGLSGNSFFVSKTGVDGGDCSNPSTPCLTITYAVNQALNSFRGNADQIINIGAGTWNEIVNVTGTGLGGGGILHFIGAGSGLTSWNGAPGEAGVLIANQGAYIGVHKMTMLGEAEADQSIIYAQLGGIHNIFEDMVFGNCFGSHFFCEGSGSQIEIWSPYTILGGYTATSHATVTSNGLIEWNPTFSTPITVNSGQSYSQPFITATVNGTIYHIGGPFSGSGGYTGPSYSATYNGVINNGSGANFPGTGTGTTANGGQYAG